MRTGVWSAKLPQARPHTNRRINKRTRTVLRLGLIHEPRHSLTVRAPYLTQRNSRRSASDPILNRWLHPSSGVPFGPPRLASLQVPAVATPVGGSGGCFRWLLRIGRVRVLLLTRQRPFLVLPASAFLLSTACTRVLRRSHGALLLYPSSSVCQI